jgi:demethoxyubiquinone hydroxylase (CLK1/Coq7/Cat5 family)
MHEVLRWLRRAHAGELGAALAYRGHARSVRRPAERVRLYAILHEELGHRAEAAVLLADRGEAGDARLGRGVARLGRVAAIGCRCTGHWAPMLGAALAEAINVSEYHRLALAAERAGDAEVVAFAVRSRRLEAEHARWFVACAARHGGMMAMVARVVPWLLRGARPADPHRRSSAHEPGEAQPTPVGDSRPSAAKIRLSASRG